MDVCVSVIIDRDKICKGWPLYQYRLLCRTIRVIRVKALSKVMNHKEDSTPLSPCPFSFLLFPPSLVLCRTNYNDHFLLFLISLSLCLFLCLFLYHITLPVSYISSIQIVEAGTNGTSAYVILRGSARVFSNSTTEGKAHGNRQAYATLT
jgi:hypothetical protein